jgi:tetratricopeptide (TPR) repeat protein
VKGRDAESLKYQTTTRGCADADLRLSNALQRLENLQSLPDGCTLDKDEALCRQQREAIEHLSAMCPTNVRSLLANAVMAYGDGRTVVAQQFLDALFGAQPGQPDAAVLRIRLALESGNISFALRFSADQIALAPTHGGLHEARASALFLAGRFDDAVGELAVAEKLGSPTWRVAYNRGLIAEKAGDLSEAAKQFQAALDARPGWSLAADRLRAIKAK